MYMYVHMQTVEFDTYKQTHSYDTIATKSVKTSLVFCCI